MAVPEAVRYLPIPLLLLSPDKTVWLASEAMGTLFGINASSATFREGSVSALLQDKRLTELGIEILQHGRQTAVSWEVRHPTDEQVCYQSAKKLQNFLDSMLSILNSARPTTATRSISILIACGPQGLQQTDAAAVAASPRPM